MKQRRGRRWEDRGAAKEKEEPGLRFIRRPEWGLLVFTSQLIYIRKLALKRSLNYV
jgi:hypothetical protein